MKKGINALYNYKGLIYDMGLERGIDNRPAFYILTEESDHIQVLIDNPMNIAMVRDWLDCLNTEVPVDFQNYLQFSKVIQEVFKVYADRYGHYLNYDNTYLNHMKKVLKVSDKTIGMCAGVGRSTVNDLTRGITKHPKFYTVGKIHSALYRMNRNQAEA